MERSFDFSASFFYVRKPPKPLTRRRLAVMKMSLSAMLVALLVMIGQSHAANGNSGSAGSNGNDNLSYSNEANDYNTMESVFSVTARGKNWE